MDFKPLHDRILVQVLEQNTKTSIGIIIPDSAKEKPMQGKVIAVGKGYRNEDGSHTDLEVKVDDVVVFGKWGGTELKLDNKEYLIMKESDILGILKNFKQ